MMAFPRVLPAEKLEALGRACTEHAFDAADAAQRAAFAAGREWLALPVSRVSEDARGVPVTAVLLDGVAIATRWSARSATLACDYGQELFRQWAGVARLAVSEGDAVLDRARAQAGALAHPPAIVSESAIARTARRESGA